MKLYRNQPKCLGKLLHAKDGRKCCECNLISDCQERLRNRLKPYFTIKKRGQLTTIDFDIGHFGYYMNDRCITKLDALYAKHANEKSSYSRAKSVGVYKIPTATHADFYRELLMLFSDPLNLSLEVGNLGGLTVD